MAVRWGIIGCGNVTEVKSGPGFQKAQGSELTAVMRRDAKLAEDYAQRHHVPRWYSDADALIADPEVDAVYIATPVSTHMHYALKVCAAGKPAYVEKPMARNQSECMVMVDAFRRAKLPLFVAYYRRGQERFRKVRDIVQSGRIGRVTGVWYRLSQPRHKRLDPANLEWRLHVEHSGGGIFMDIGSHTLDIIDFIVGPIASVGGRAANLVSPYLVEDNVVMHWQHENGAMGMGAWNFAAHTDEDMIEILGTDGRVALSTFGLEPAKLVTASGEESLTFETPMHVAQPLIQMIVDELNGKGTCPSTGESGARTAAVMDRVLEAYYGGRMDDFWNRPETWPGRREGM